MRPGSTVADAKKAAPREEGNMLQFEQFPGQGMPAVAACSWGLNRLDVFWRMADGRLRHRWFDGAWRSAPIPTRCAVATQQGTLGHRGRRQDPLYRIRQLLLTAQEQLT
jgi:hypothetical protein